MDSGDVSDNLDKNISRCPFLGHISHSGSQTTASHLYGQCLLGFLVTIYLGHLFEFLKRLIWFAYDNQPSGGFWQPPVKEAGA